MESYWDIPDTSDNSLIRKWCGIRFKYLKIIKTGRLPSPNQAGMPDITNTGVVSGFLT